MAKSRWTIGELVYISYPTPGYGRVIGLKKVKWGNTPYLTLSVERIFDHQGNKTARRNKINRNEGYFTKVDKKYCDKISKSFNTMVDRLNKINKENDPRRIK